jgi:acyl-CoA synthetase (NDP forming)
VPTFPFPEPAARALAKAVEYGQWRSSPEGVIVELPDVRREKARSVVEGALDRMDGEGGWLDPDEVAAVLVAYGLSLPEGRTVTDRTAAVAAAADIGGPVVLKVVAPSALHKSDVGGVVLDVEGEAAVGRAYEQVTSAVADPEGVLVQEFVGGGHEVLIGMTEDPLFGPLIVFGLGGVFVELVGDAAFRIHPLTDLEAAEMVESLKTGALLHGYRGGPPGDVAAVQQTLLRVSALVEDVPEIVEMDLNPVKVRPPGEGVRVVDARIRVRPVEGAWVPTRRDIPSVV